MLAIAWAPATIRQPEPPPPKKKRSVPERARRIEPKPVEAPVVAMFPLHNGEAFGPFGRWIVFASGLVLPELGVTGLLLWLRRRNAEGRRRAFDARFDEPAESYP